MQIESCLDVDGDLPELYQPFTFATYPPEGDQVARQRCEQFVAAWDGRQTLGLISPRCGGPGKTGLMVGAYKALLPRIHAAQREGAWLHMVSFFELCEYGGSLGRVAEYVYSAGLLVLDDLAYFPVQGKGLQELTRLLEYRIRNQRPTFFVADSVESMQERLTPHICSLLLDESTVVEVYGPNLWLIVGAQNNPEQAKEDPDLYDAYAYLNPGYNAKQYAQGQITSEWAEEEKSEEDRRKEAALRRMEANTLLQQMLLLEPRLVPIIQAAQSQRSYPGYDRIQVYSELKMRAYPLVGMEAEHPQLRTSAHYDAMMTTIVDLLPPDATDS